MARRTTTTPAPARATKKKTTASADLAPSFVPSAVPPSLLLEAMVEGDLAEVDADLRVVVNRVILIAAIHPHPFNYNHHGDEQLARLGLSDTRFGQVRSIVVQAGAPGVYLLVAGEGYLTARRLASKRYVRADVIPATWSAQQVTGYLVADNELARLSAADETQLAALLEEQRAADYALETLGYDDASFTRLLDRLADELLGGHAVVDDDGEEYGEGDADHAPRRLLDDPDGGGDEFDATPDEDHPTRCQPGDLWRLGVHLLLCGDSTQAADVTRVMDGVTAQMVWTDPPYGVAYVGKTKAALTIRNDALTTQELYSLLCEAFARAVDICDEGAPWYVASPGGPQLLAFAQPLADLGIWRQSITWVKQSLVVGHNDYHYRHEHLFYGWKPGAKHYFIADRSQDTVWQIARPTVSREHPTMKPLPLIAKALANSSHPGAIVYDGFGGSGSTLIACERLARKCRMLELDPHYCDVIIRRWESETGRLALHLSSAGGVVAHAVE